MDRNKFPFKMGQFAEARSFIVGYRGAWFRCKIREIRLRKGDLEYAVEYYDFPEEKLEWIKLHKKSSKSKESTLMIRPIFPPIHNEGEVDIRSISEEVVIVNNAWKKGDFVDWWADGCYWSGRLTEVFGNDKFQIELFPPPAGEGLSYEVSSKDLRPSLDWSLEHGWTLPIPVGSKGHCSSACLVKPVDQGVLHTDIEGIKDHIASTSSQRSTSCTPPPDRSEKTAKRPLNTTAGMMALPLEINKHLNPTDSGIGKTNCSGSTSSLRAEKASGEVKVNVRVKDGHHENDSLKKMRTDRSIYLNTMSSNTIEAAIFDLEELVNRVKWIKDILQFGMPLPNTVHPSWNFLEHRASSLQK